MSTSKRITKYLDLKVHRALCLHAAAAGQTISDIVNDAVNNLALAEDAHNLAAFKKRADEHICSLRAS